MSSRSSLVRRAVFASLLALTFVTCAEPVADIDRTQGNFIRKADLQGEWHVLQTVVEVPPTSGVTFMGETSKLERVRWEVQESLLVAYRSYPQIPGADHPSTGVPFDGKDAPLAAYPILSHFDITREYASESGEQSNVISENDYDRKWFERAYIRVDWSRSQLINFDFITPMLTVTGADDSETYVPVTVSASSFVQAEEGGPDAFYAEVNPKTPDAAMSYFDVLGKLVLDADLDACWYTWAGFGAYDCASAEVKIRTSFSRVNADSGYEPFHYDDQMMSRFGYFRSERFTYDEQRGLVDSGRQYLIQRHRIFERATDADGKLIPVPERLVHTVPYYLSPEFPDDSLLLEAARATMAQWSHAGKRAVAAAKGEVEAAVDDMPDVFVLCQNPVVSGDPAACGEPGFAPRMGDLRYSTLHWIDTETLEGLLGYGPSAADPLTGEIISGKAYVYGSSVSTWAGYALDVIRFFNDDLDFDTLTYGGHFAESVKARVQALETVEDHDPKLNAASVRRPVSGPRKPARPQVRRENLRPFDAGKVTQRQAAARAAGQTPMLQNSEVRRLVESRTGMAFDDLPEALRDRFDPTRLTSPDALKARTRGQARARAHNADMTDMLEPNIEGLVRKYAGRTDYDTVWRELRAEIFASTAEHEVGHTVGLRHNFQGSYDSLNYDDEYWRLREETLATSTSLGDIYAQSELTPAQSEGQMRQYQYSSIMDYGFSWANDITGLGKYDEAAFIFGYTAGTYEVAGSQCDDYPSTDAVEGKCLARLPGYVEVFGKRKDELGEAGALLSQEEFGSFYEDPSLPSIAVLERYHYTTVAQAFPSLDDLSESGRTLMRYADYLDARAADGEDRPVRVPYMFCSDEWESGLLSCRVFDQGADPFEMTRSINDEYRAYYAFVNFRRDRFYFDVIDPLYRYYANTFLPLSDIFQAWYLAPYGFDDVFDRTYELAINAGFNLFAEAIATPPYGTYCETQTGRLMNLSDEPTQQGGDIVSDSACVLGSDRFNIAPGTGRRRFSRYDGDAGYYFEWKPFEAGHYWTTYAAVLALVDPDAYTIGLEGDAGTYSISYYDWFPDEMEQLLNAVLAEDYSTFAPRAVDATAVGASVPAGGSSTDLELQYRPIARAYDYETGQYFDPERGTYLEEGSTGAGPVGLCEPCALDGECAGHTGDLLGVYCQPYGDTRVCLFDCTDDAASCPNGTACVLGNCLPSGRRTCEDFIGACGENFRQGRCRGGLTCEGGACVPAASWSPVVETDSTFMLATDILYYGFLYTTSSYSTRFNDQLNVFRPGNGTAIETDPATSEQVTFTDPLRGVTYAAVQPRCDVNNGIDRSTPACGQCLVDQQCAGFTGRPTGTMCAPIDGAGVPGYCVQRCTLGQDECPEGTTCNGAQLCVPAGGCREPETRCQILQPDDTGAVKLVKRGRSLSTAYESALEAYYTYDGPDEDLNDRLATEYYRSAYAITNHLDLLETVIATYGIFGRVY